VASSPHPVKIKPGVREKQTSKNNSVKNLYIEKQTSFLNLKFSLNTLLSC
jgi:hypothetical protein